MANTKSLSFPNGMEGTYTTPTALTDRCFAEHLNQDMLIWPVPLSRRCAANGRAHSTAAAQGSGPAPSCSPRGRPTFWVTERRSPIWRQRIFVVTRFPTLRQPA